jgi:hypothetical protein
VLGIQSLDDLLSALADEARELELSEFPDLAQPPRLGIAEPTARLIASEFDLDPSYLAVAQRTDVTQLEIGFIWGSPSSKPGSNLVYQLRSLAWRPDGPGRYVRVASEGRSKGAHGSGTTVALARTCPGVETRLPHPGCPAIALAEGNSK